LCNAATVQFRVDRGIGKNGLDFRRKQQSPILLPVKQWLYAHAVPGQKQPFGPFLPYPKSENAIEFLQTPFPPLDIGM